MTWNELLTGDYLTVTDGMLDGSTNAKELVGNLIIPNSVTSLQTYALSDCDSLTSVVVPNSITELPNGCFSLMSSIKNLTIPSTIQVLGETVFSSSLENLYFEGTIEQWINFDFPTLTSCAYYTDNFFCQGERITHVDYPTYLTEVKQYSLCGLRDLKTLNLHSGIKAIRTHGIAYCENLEELNIPSSVNLIEKSAFIYDSKIKSVRIPDGLTEISTDMFYQCSSLENIYIPNSVTSIQNEAFMYNAFKTINIPSSVTYIGDKAFSDCPNLETIVLPNTITYIGSHAFEDCLSLKSVTLPAYIDTIYSYTFRNCTSLESIIIPTTVTTIQSYAFTNCAMKSVYIPTSVVKFSGSGKTAAFHGNLGIVIYCGVSAKPSSGWGSYWNVVEGTSSSSYVYADVKYGYTYAQYLSETGATA